MLSVEEALRRFLAPLKPLAAEQVSVGDGLGRCLRGVVSRRTQPPFAVSAMDGYAARAVDVASVPARLRVVGAAPAGGAFAGRVGAGEAVRIFTGARVRQAPIASFIQETRRERATGSPCGRAPLPATISGPKGSISGPAIAGSPPELC